MDWVGIPEGGDNKEVVWCAVVIKEREAEWEPVSEEKKDRDGSINTFSRKEENQFENENENEKQGEWVKEVEKWRTSLSIQEIIANKMIVKPAKNNNKEKERRRDRHRQT